MVALSFSEKYSLRTKQFAVQSILFYVKHCKKSEEIRIIGKQFLRSSTPLLQPILGHLRVVGLKLKNSLNYVLYWRKWMSPFFWIELLEEAQLIQKEDISGIKMEAIELLKIISTTRKNMKNQRSTSNA